MSHNKILFYTTRGLTGDVSLNFHNHLRILETASSNIDFLTNAKTDRAKDIFYNANGFKINNVLNLFSKDFEILRCLSDWSEVYDRLDVTELQDYSELFIMGGMYFPQSELSRLGKRTGVFPKDRGQLKFESTALHCINILALLKAHREYKIPLHEWCKTPEEITTNLFHKDFSPIESINHTYHGFNLKKYGQKRLDSFQYTYEKKEESFLNCSNKVYDITFGLTVFGNTDRDKYVEDLKSSFSPNSNFYIRNNKTGESNFLTNEQYFDKIKKSKYTFIIPPYDENSFSIYRFIESLSLDCLPLIHPSCKIDDVEQSFNTDLSPILRLEPFSYDEEYVYLLNKYKTDFLTFKEGFAR